MKRLLTIFLVALVLFNTVGIQGLLLGLRYKTKHDLVKRLDSGLYDDGSTVTLKVPLALPYAMDDADYERVDGEFEYRGEFFRLVKQRLVRDTLHLVCIKDNKSKHIKKALADYIKTATDKPFDGKQDGKTQSGFVKDYLIASFSISGLTAGWNRTVFSPSSFCFFQSRSTDITIQPPEA